MQGGIALFVVFFIISAIVAAANSLDPLGVRLIPVDCLPQPVIQRNRRLPAQFAFHLLAIKSIPPVMPRTILDVREQRLRLADHLQQTPRDGQILFDVETPDVIYLANAPALENGQNSAAIIFYVQPIALLLAVAVDWQSFAVEGIGRSSRAETFREIETGHNCLMTA